MGETLLASYSKNYFWIMFFSKSICILYYYIYKSVTDTKSNFGSVDYWYVSDHKS